MALVTFRHPRYERVVSWHGDYREVGSGWAEFTHDGVRGASKTIRVATVDVLEVRTGATMRAHCHHCWNDCTHMHPDGIRVCEAHVQGVRGARPLDDDEMWDRGPRDRSDEGEARAVACAAGAGDDGGRGRHEL